MVAGFGYARFFSFKRNQVHGSRMQKLKFALIDGRIADIFSRLLIFILLIEIISENIVGNNYIARRRFESFVKTFY